MKPSLLLLVCVYLFATASALATDSAVRFNCHFKDINTKADGERGELDFIRDVKSCGGDDGGVCFVPIDHLKTEMGCRDFAASFDQNSEPKTLDVTLWSYCGNATNPDTAQSQTVSIPTESKHFQLTTEWAGFLTVVICDRP